MTNGQLTVTVTLPKAVWTATKKATLTVSDPATAGTGICGWVVANKTFVATVTADPE
jgi:type IV secretory pathway TrbD component